MSDDLVKNLRQYIEDDRDRHCGICLAPVEAMDIADSLEEFQAELAALRRENEQQQERIGRLCSFPLCDCKSDECLVLDGPIPEHDARKELLERAEKAESERKTLRRTLEYIANEAGQYADGAEDAHYLAREMAMLEQEARQALAATTEDGDG